MALGQVAAFRAQIVQVLRACDQVSVEQLDAAMATMETTCMVASLATRSGSILGVIRDTGVRIVAAVDVVDASGCLADMARDHVLVKGLVVRCSRCSHPAVAGHCSRPIMRILKLYTNKTKHTRRREMWTYMF